MNPENMPRGGDDFMQPVDAVPTNPRESIWEAYAKAKLTALPDGRTVKLDSDGNVVNYPFFLID